jgi:hypothetical protein
MLPKPCRCIFRPSRTICRFRRRRNCMHFRSRAYNQRRGAPPDRSEASPRRLPARRATCACTADVSGDPAGVSTHLSGIARRRVRRRRHRASARRRRDRRMRRMPSCCRAGGSPARSTGPPVPASWPSAGPGTHQPREAVITGAHRLPTPRRRSLPRTRVRAGRAGGRAARVVLQAGAAAGRRARLSSIALSGDLHRRVRLPVRGPPPASPWTRRCHEAPRLRSVARVRFVLFDRTGAGGLRTAARGLAHRDRPGGG